MLKKIKNTVIKIDRFFYKKFGKEKKLYFLENLKEAKIIFSHLNKNSKISQVMFVGGCVRKALKDENIDDIDLATSIQPNDVKDILLKEDIRVIETGISHGTVTAILNKIKFEITTLREDITTDGRHANVQFTKSWENDASRRDITINAIYADIDGKIFDPLNGVYDLQNGLVQFIGSPEERIQEDYLRILRFIRFFIQYSKIDIDINTLQSIKKNINGLNQISNERIFDEIKKILSLKNINDLFTNNQLKEIFLKMFPQFKFYERINIFNNLSKKLKDEYSYIDKLALLIIDETDNYDFFCFKYKVSNNIKKKLKKISEYYKDFKSKGFSSHENIKKLIYLNNKEIVRDILLFLKCSDNKFKSLDLEQILDFVNKYKIPKFPISGETLKEYGYKSGKDLGNKLKILEKNWIDNNFIINKKFLDKNLKKII